MPATHPDDLDLYIAERAAKNPEFPQLVDAAITRRELARQLAAKRKELGLSQADIAKKMKTSQPAVARLEKAVGDVKISSFERYAATLGCQLTFSLAPTAQTKTRSSVS